MTTTRRNIIPYRRGADIDYATLEFDPGAPVERPDAMEQSFEQWQIFGLIMAHFNDFNRDTDVFIDNSSYICYDPNNLNVRIAPDLYVVFGVDATSIRPRKIYLPWEVGKPPDWVLEIASESTWREDVDNKPAIYARIGVPEYWRFDPSGNYYGYPLAGDRLINGVYQPIELTTEPDGILKGYSEVLQMSFCWDNGLPRLYDPVTGEYPDDWQHDRAARHEAEVRAAEAEAEVRRLREQLRRQQGE